MGSTRSCSQSLGKQEHPTWVQDAQTEVRHCDAYASKTWWESDDESTPEILWETAHRVHLSSTSTPECTQQVLLAAMKQEQEGVNPETRKESPFLLQNPSSTLFHHG